MKDFSSFFITFFFMTAFIGVVTIPMLGLLQKRNILSSRNRLFAIYSLVLTAFLISCFHPEVNYARRFAELLGLDIVNNFLFHVREFVSRLFILILGTEDYVYKVAIIGIFTVFTLGIVLYIISIGAILLKINSYQLGRRLGKLHILVDQKNVIPHVFSFLGKSYVVIPERLLKEKELLRTALLHELQHIRNGDTGYVYMFQFVKCLMWINPLSYFIHSEIKYLQEKIVDESLIHGKKVNYKLYLKTLSWCFDKNAKTSYSMNMSYAIFGWSTLRELKSRIQNIHRVKPLRSQPILLVCMLILNISALVIIDNSSPKFHYSLYDLQRMYMPEYLKREFIFQVGHDFPGIGVRMHTLEIGKEQSITLEPDIGIWRKRFLLKSKNREAVEEYDKLMARNPSPSEEVRRYLYNMTFKVVEYSDEHVVVHVRGKIFNFKRAALQDDFDNTIYENRIAVKYDTDFYVEGVSTPLKVRQKLIHEPISYFEKPKAEIIAQSGAAH